MQLREIAPEIYARDVLPLTAPLWAGRRSFDVYVEQTLETARSGYGRRHYRTIGLFDGATLVASFKRYERLIRDGERQLHAIGFGAVYTPAEFRGRGYASVMLAAELDRARKAGCALAYLFSDIRPQFYTSFGFVELPSRDLTLRAADLPAQRVRPAALAAGDWNGVRRCFASCERERSYGFERSQSAWGWIMMRIKHGSEHAAGHEFNLVVRRGRGVRAYVLGARVPERDAYVVDEYGHAGEESAALIPPLLRAAAGDLRRIIGWLPPAGSRDLLPKGTTRKRNRSIFMMVPLRPDGRRLVDCILAERSGDFCWATEHI
ncbi:MAG: GNAT family N-acetyltransferase [Candidatus Cybelea sp.]